jgi:hypothetical protein
MLTRKELTKKEAKRKAGTHENLAIVAIVHRTSCAQLTQKNTSGQEKEAEIASARFAKLLEQMKSEDGSF